MVTKRRSQEESEAPAKVYQLDAVDEKVDSALDLLKQLIEQTKGVATHVDLANLKKEVEIEYKEYIDDEMRKVHLEYGPTKRAALWVLGIVIVALVGNAILTIMSRGG